MLRPRGGIPGGPLPWKRAVGRLVSVPFVPRALGESSAQAPFWEIGKYSL